jgi:hypothetical protein
VYQRKGSAKNAEICGGTFGYSLISSEPEWKALTDSKTDKCNGKAKTKNCNKTVLYNASCLGVVLGAY